MINLLLRWMFPLTLLTNAVFFMLPAFADEQPDPSNVQPLERRPYDIRLLVAFDSKSFDAAASQSILRDVDFAARRCAGDVWSLIITDIDWLNPVSDVRLQRIDRSLLTQRFPGQSADVWFVATVEALPIGTRVSVRSWQPDVQLETSVVSTEVADRRAIGMSILRLCRDLIRPIGVVEQVNDKSARIRLRAGELSSPDPSFVQLAKGDLLLPMIAFRDKNRVIERFQTIPWTYISVDTVDGSTIVGTVQSGVRMALAAKKRGRIETVVVALRSQRASTRVELMTQSKPQHPLVAHRIEVRSDPIIPRPTEEKPDLDPSSTLLNELLTDRRGLVNISVTKDQPLIWLFAYSGQNLLARVPFVPGMTPEERLEVPDDSTRLAAEADLQMLQSEVIDAVALRNTAMATIRAAAKQNDWTTVKQKLTLLKRQQAVAGLIDRLNAVRVAGTTAAKSRKDKTAEARINRMCDETTTLIKVHLGGDKVTTLTEEMEALQSADATSEKP